MSFIYSNENVFMVLVSVLLNYNICDPLLKCMNAMKTNKKTFVRFQMIKRNMEHSDVMKHAWYSASTPA